MLTISSFYRPRALPGNQHTTKSWERTAAHEGDQPLIAANQDDDLDVRSEAIRALGQIGAAAAPAVHTLIDLLERRRPQIILDESTPSVGTKQSRRVWRL
jgi:hypothetical protein